MRRGAEQLARAGDVEGTGRRARAEGQGGDRRRGRGAAGDLVIVSVPLRAYREVPVEPLAGKTVPRHQQLLLPARRGLPELDADSITSSELLQQHLPRPSVVKVFNNIYFVHLAALPRPAGAADRSALAIAGDDAGAKDEATAFLDRSATTPSTRGSARGRVALPAGDPRLRRSVRGRQRELLGVAGECLPTPRRSRPGWTPPSS